MNPFPHAEWQRALRTLNSARQLIENDPDSAASRAYYAAFHGLTARFALHGQTFVKHSALRAAVHRDLVQVGKWDKQLGKDFDFLMDMRETADYGVLTQVTPESADMAVRKAEILLNAIRTECPELLGHE